MIRLEAVERGVLLPRRLLLRDGRAILLREAEVADSGQLISRVHRIAGESRNISLEPGEFPLTLEQERAFIRAVSAADNQLFLLALDGDEIVGDLLFRGGPYRRTRHRGMMGMSVNRSHWGLGIGTALLQTLIDWARASGVVRKIDLRVMTYNERALRLYRRFGFQVEGRHARTFCIDGEFFDDYSMGLLVDPLPQDGASDQDEGTER
jgi:RimJ/RimL family protein N-acetyltransferase